jgi:hypothetical protein
MKGTAAFTAVIMLWPCLAAGDGPGGAGKAEAQAGAGKVPVDSSEREKQILALFSATVKKFENGGIILEYDFEKQSPDRESLAEDWRPTLAETKKRIRWSQGYEGTWTRYEHGLVIGDFGQWIHKAVFLPDVEVKFVVLRVSQARAGALLAPVFFNEKKNRSLGVSNGYQAVALSGWKPVKPPHPKADRPLPPSASRHSIGYRYSGKVLEAYLNGKKTSDTSAVPAFTEGFDTGHVGLAWGPPIQSFVFHVRMQGKLDPDWVAEQLGEKAGKAAKPAKGEKPGKGEKTSGVSPSRR